MSEEPINVYRWAQVSSQLAYLSGELPNSSIRNVAFEQVDHIPWTNDLADIQFTTFRAVGWRRALEGDYLSAFRYLKQAGACAPTIPSRIMIGCDRAYLAASLGEPRWAHQELSEAAELAQRVQWGATSDEERIVLLLLAEQYAPHDGAQAMSYVARFQEPGDRAAKVTSLKPDRRLQAMAAYSLGYVRQHLAESPDAEASYREAFEIYDTLGYDWRAGRTAIGLAQVSADPSPWLEAARKKLAPYPQSWLMMQLRTLEGENATPVPDKRRRSRVATIVTEELTPAQREVYELLLTGISTREIAEELERSEFTVRNHIKAIFKKAKVNSRAALLSASFALGKVKTAPGS